MAPNAIAPQSSAIVPALRQLSLRAKLIIGGGAFAAIIGLALAFWKRKEIATVTMNLLDKAQWAKFVYDTAGANIPGLSTAGQLLLTAHAAYESGWGQVATAAKLANNIFNVTAGSVWLKANKPTLIQKDADWEYYKGAVTPGQLPPPAKTPWQQDKAGKWRRRIDQTWRKYADIRASILDYWDFLGPNQNNGRYLTARNALQVGNVPLFASELYKAGYFTLPPATYTSEISAIVSTVSKFLAS